MHYNIVEDGQWKVGGKHLDVPSMFLTEYQQQTAGLIQSEYYWLKQLRRTAQSLGENTANINASNISNMLKQAKKGIMKLASVAVNNAELVSPSNDDSYQGLYVAEATENRYTLPYYNEYNHTIMQTWGENKGTAGNFVDSAVRPILKYAVASASIDTAYQWEGGTPANYIVHFQLLNTIDTTSWQYHQQFLKTFITQNLHHKLNAVMSLPPVIYTVDIPGIRYSPAAAIDNLTIKNLGMMNKINNEIIPDAYDVSFNIKELIIESRNIFQSRSKVTAIVEQAEIKKEDGQILTDAISKVLKENEENEKQ